MCSVVSLLILHFIDFYTSEDGIIIFSVSLVCINLITILISHSVIEAGSRFMNASLDVKQFNASKVYFSYTIIIGFMLSLVISLSILLALKSEITFTLLDYNISDQQSWVYTWLVVAFSVFYFLAETRKILRVEGLTTQNLIMGFSFIMQQLYIITLQITISQILGNEINLYSFLLTFIGPLVINGAVQFCNVFHVKEKNINYKSIHVVQKQLMKPFRSKVMFDILKNTCYYILLNAGDALIYFLTFEAIIQSEEYITVSFSILFVELSNCLNKAIASTMDSPFRINIQLKRFDRVQQILGSAFVLLFVNFLYQFLIFSIRNKIYRLVFSNEFDSALSLQHSCIDGLFGTFNAYTTAYVRADQKHKTGLVIGTVKMVLVVFFWLIGSKLNSTQAHFSTMIFYYKYCVDILGFGFYILVFKKFHNLKKVQHDQNMQQNDVIQENQNAILIEPRLVLKQMQPLDHISRTASTDNTNETHSKEEPTSKDISRSSKYNIAPSQCVSEKGSISANWFQNEKK
ncbi:MatE_and transmembrane domain-containing protein [Hexamita inflata]|uniref:MatE and transmembrane domain-containing protein n=1 Tax=Hexamita inflata TaxID=28002 RepID=A0AA86P7G2_9EUKA|nr:MatE and transmembrane domain-containing protein [Hexamita inflata]